MPAAFRRMFSSFTSYSTDEATRKNIINSIGDGAWYAVMTGLTTSFMGVYALALGASDAMLGWLAALPALVALLSQVPAALITERAVKRMRVLWPSTVAFRLGYLVFAFIPFLPIAPVAKAWVFIGLFAVMSFPGTVSGVSWTAMMGDIFPANLRGRIFGDRNMLLGIVALASTVAAGPLLDALPYPLNFTILFLVAFLALLISLVYLRRITERPDSDDISVVRTANLKSIAATLSDKPFLSFVAAMFVIHIGFNISAAMWTLLYVRVLLLSKTFIALITVVAQLTSVLCFRWWGRLADRIGPRRALFYSVLLFAPQPFLHMFVKTSWPLIPLSIASGVAGSGFTLILFNVLLGVAADERKRPSYIAVFNGLMGLTGFLAPLIGVAIYGHFSMNTVFLIATIVRLAGLLLFARQFRLKPVA
ncbi:MAG TPA: MFS transporter [Bacillota bacterium]|nr:MFS transporter [Bacillota bacterium]